MWRSDSTLKGLYLSADPLFVGKDRTLSGFIMMIGAFTQGCANPGLQDGIPMGFSKPPMTCKLDIVKPARELVRLPFITFLSYTLSTAQLMLVLFQDTG